MDGVDRQLDVAHRPPGRRARTERIVALGLPIIGGMVSQNVFNLVDTAMVGRLGDAALAAVGSASFVNFLLMAWVMGMGGAVQAMVARRAGEGRRSIMAKPLNGALLLSLLVALPWSIVMYLAAPWLFRVMNDSPDVMTAAVPYLEMRVLAISAVAMNMSFRGYWNAVNLSKLYLRALIVMHLSNIVLNYGLIFGELGMPELGTQGAGLGSAIATYIGAAYYMMLGFRFGRAAGFLRVLPDRQTMRNLLKLAVPGAVQQVFFAGGFAGLFWILGQVGTRDTAAANVLINVMLVAILPGIALGMAAATLVGQALGRGRPEDARAWAWDVVLLACVLLALLGLPMVVFPRLILGLFIHDAVTLQVAELPLRIFGSAIALDGIGIVLSQALVGAGGAATVMRVSVALQWGLFLPIAYALGPELGYGVTAIWIAQSAYRALQGGIFALIWRRGRWAALRV